MRSSQECCQKLLAEFQERMKLHCMHNVPAITQRAFPPEAAWRNRRKRAFSLVEVTLAIGIIAFAFVAIFGLVPIGLGSFRAALDTSVRAQIAQRLATEAQQTDFDTLLKDAKRLRYFDDEGTEVSENASIYTVGTELVATTALPVDAVSDNLLTLTVKIAANPGRNADPFAPEIRIAFTRHVAFVARSR